RRTRTRDAATATMNTGSRTDWTVPILKNCGMRKSCLECGRRKKKCDGLMPCRCVTLSASPATGLVGMQENAFLSDFFGCVGFLPLTTPSHVRGAMVRMMTGPTAQQQLSALHDSPQQGQFGAVFTEGGITTGTQLSTGPSACTFWCAVGVGALVKGTPTASVRRSAVIS
ncbi:unnamed protein product, partial [Ectocarpus fasciculatus]